MQCKCFTVTRILKVQQSRKSGRFGFCFVCLFLVQRNSNEKEIKQETGKLFGNENLKPSADFT